MGIFDQADPEKDKKLLAYYKSRVESFEGTMKQILDLIDKNSMDAKQFYEIQWANKER